MQRHSNLSKVNLADLKYNWVYDDSIILIYLFNLKQFSTKIQKKGKYLFSFKIFFSFFCLLKQIIKGNGFDLLNQAFLSILPPFYFMIKHISGRKIQIPVRAKFIKAYSEVWFIFIKNSILRTESSLILRLLGEYKDLVSKRGATYKFFDERLKQVYELRHNYKLLKKFK